VKICNQLVKNWKKYSFSDRTQGGQIWFLQGSKSILKKCKKKAKRAKPKFWGNTSKCCLVPNSWNLAPKGSTWQPWLRWTALWTVQRQHRITMMQQRSSLLHNNEQVTYQLSIFFVPPSALNLPYN